VAVILYDVAEAPVAARLFTSNVSVTVAPLWTLAEPVRETTDVAPPYTVNVPVTGVIPGADAVAFNVPVLPTAGA
jgi:hypothetical protein